jgi:outer membrane lipoprotein LolB
VGPNVRSVRFLLLAFLLLQGCSLLKHSERTEQAWEAHRAQLTQVDRFTLQARVSSGGVFGVKGNLTWRQAPDAFDMRVAGPFGIGAATISGRGREIEIRTSKRSFVTQDPEADLKSRLGWSFPVSHLRYWILGQPAPGSRAEFGLDRDGRLETLEQDGWALEFEEYQSVGALELPRKLQVTNNEIKLKIVVDTWSGLPAAR